MYVYTYSIEDHSYTWTKFLHFMSFCDSFISVWEVHWENTIETKTDFLNQENIVS